MKPTETVFSKWIIEGIPGYVFGSDKELYRLQFATYPNHYGLRKLKKQTGKRWRINNDWWSERQLKRKLKKNSYPKVLIEPELDCQF